MKKTLSILLFSVLIGHAFAQSDCFRIGRYIGNIQINENDNSNYELFLPWKVFCDSINEFNFSFDSMTQNNLKCFLKVMINKDQQHYETGSLLGGPICEVEKFTDAKKYRIIIFRDNKPYKELFIDKNMIEFEFNRKEMITLIIKMPIIDLKE